MNSSGNSKPKGGKKSNAAEWSEWLYDSPAVYRVVLLLLLIGLMFGTMNTNRSYAWFADSKAQQLELKAGAVHYTLNTEPMEGKLVPEKNLFSKISLVNASTIDTDLRVQVSYTIWERNESGAVTSSSAWYIKNASDADAPAGQYLDTSLILGDTGNPGAGGFVYRDETAAPEGSKEGWWEYQTRLPAVKETAASNGASAGVELALFHQPFRFCYDGPRTTKVFANRQVTVTMTFQAKQSDYVTWQEIGTVMMNGAF